MCKYLYKIPNSSLAREAIRAFREEDKLAPAIDYHHRFCHFVRTPNFKVEEVKKDAGAPKDGGKQQQQTKGGKQQK